MRARSRSSTRSRARPSRRRRTRPHGSRASRIGHRVALAEDPALVDRHPARHPAPAPRRARRARLRRLRDLDHADPRVRVPRARVHGLEERRRHQLRADRHRRRRARLPRLLEAGRRAPRQGRPVHVERRALCPTIVRDVESVGRRLRARARDQARAAGLRRRAAPDPPRRQQPLQPRRPRGGSCGRGSSSPTTPTAS